MELEVGIMRQEASMEEGVRIWREQLGGMWLAKARSFVDRGYEGYRSMIRGQLASLVELGIADSQKHTGIELMASAFGSGATISLMVAMLRRPLAMLFKAGVSMHSDDLLDGVEALLHSEYVAVMAFLVSADMALGQPRRLLEEFEAIEKKAPLLPVLSTPGVH